MAQGFIKKELSVINPIDVSIRNMTIIGEINNKNEEEDSQKS